MRAFSERDMLPPPRVRLDVDDGDQPFRLHATLLRTFGDVFLMMPLAGARFHQPALARLALTHPPEEFPCVLIPEPTNPHDENAIAVWTRGGHVGYIPRLEACHMVGHLRKLEDEHGTAIAIIGSLDIADFGFDITFEMPEALRE